MAKCIACDSDNLKRYSGYRCSDVPSRALFGNRSLARCASCGLVQVQPLPTTEELNHYYSTTYRSETWNIAVDVSLFPRDMGILLSRGRSQAQLLMRCLPNTPADARILDIGAGFGHILWCFKELLPEARLVACEPDPGCKPFLEKAGAQVLPLLIDGAASLAAVASKGPFDVIILSHVLEHSLHPREFLAMVGGLLAPGGAVVLEVPHCPPEQLTARGGNDAPHITFFTADTLQALTDRLNWEPLFLDTCGPRLRRRTIASTVRRLAGALARRLHLAPRPSGPAAGTGSEAVPPEFLDDRQRIPQPECAQYGGQGRRWIRGIFRPR